jgi:Putative prokaryotic signal transducing protein
VGRLILLRTLSTPTEGHLLRGRLEAEGIPVLVKGEGEGPYRMGPLYLWIHEENEIRARLILAEVEGGSLAIDESDELPEEGETLSSDR